LFSSIFDVAMGRLSIPDHAKRLFESRVRFIPGSNVIYLLNPKVASSSVLASMWQAHDAKTAQITFRGNPHDLQSSPFLKGAAAQHAATLNDTCAPFFSIVRNPYARFASAYLSKVARRNDPAVWDPLSRTLGLPHDETPCVSKFLEALIAADAESLDWHFCPQHVNLLAPLVPLDFTGHLESMDEVQAFLRNNGVPLLDYTPHAGHATRANQRVRELIEACDAQMILRFYEADFILYNYSENPERVDRLAN
jgi:hypothetical protein